MELGENSSATIPYLPNEIIMEILCKLPVKSLVRFRCVCKFWQSLTTSDRSFIQSHYQQSLSNNSNSSRNVLLHADRNFTMASKCNEPNYQELTQRLRDSGHCILSNQPFFLGTNLNFSGSTNGVLCVSTFCNDETHFHHTNIHLWNPALHQCWTLPPSNYQSNRYLFRCLVVGFFLDVLTDDYRVVKVFYETASLKVEMYSLRNNSWKPIDFNDLRISRDGYIMIKDMAIAHRGCLHWTSWHDSLTARILLNILDVSLRNFKDIFLPFDVSVQFAITNQLCMYKGCLTLIGFPSADECEIWMMKEYGVDNSWTKQYSIRSLVSDAIHVRITTAITPRGKNLALKEGYIVLYDPETQKVEDTQIKVDNYDRPRFFLADYVESLMSVIPPTHADDTKLCKKRKILHSVKKRKIVQNL